jgi:hypothetical protein
MRSQSPQVQISARQGKRLRERDSDIVPNGQREGKLCCEVVEEVLKQGLQSPGIESVDV